MATSHLTTIDTDDAMLDKTHEALSIALDHSRKLQRFKNLICSPFRDSPPKSLFTSYRSLAVDLQYVLPHLQDNAQFNRNLMGGVLRQHSKGPEDGAHCVQLIEREPPRTDDQVPSRELRRVDVSRRPIL